jgi:N-acetyl-gamma-glutamyl-phosphate reductase
MATEILAGVIGASGYSGIELLRLLDGHPNFSVTLANSRKLAGQPVPSAYPALRGRLQGLEFTDSQPTELASAPEELFFLALPHGVAAEFARPLYDAGKTVIDLSADFRLGSAGLYKDYYGTDHPDPELLAAGAYIIPEIHGMAGYENHRLFACPGCYPTSIQLPLTPLIRNRVVGTEGIVICSYSGVSGAGKKVDEMYLYCERDESARAYGLPRHRHLSEIEEQLGIAAGGKEVTVQFAPHLAPMKRGIHSTLSVPAVGTLEEVYRVWEKAYEDSPLVQVLPTGEFPDTAHVAGTSRADISAVHDIRTGRFILTSVIDNLLKGASGQAVQIANLRYGFPETAGLL